MPLTGANETGPRGNGNEARDGAAHAWVGERGAVSVEVGVEMHILCELGKGGRVCFEAELFEGVSED